MIDHVLYIARSSEEQGRLVKRIQGDRVRSGRRWVPGLTRAFLRTERAPGREFQLLALAPMTMSVIVINQLIGRVTPFAR
jgi:hypothetical protein